MVASDGSGGRRLGGEGYAYAALREVHQAHFHLEHALHTQASRWACLLDLPNLPSQVAKQVDAFKKKAFRRKLAIDP